MWIGSLNSNFLAVFQVWGGNFIQQYLIAGIILVVKCVGSGQTIAVLGVVAQECNNAIKLGVIEQDDAVK